MEQIASNNFFFGYCSHGYPNDGSETLQSVSLVRFLLLTKNEKYCLNTTSSSGYRVLYSSMNRKLMNNYANQKYFSVFLHRKVLSWQQCHFAFFR